MNNSYYEVGKIVNTHGLQGEVKVVTFSDFKEERYQPGNVLYLFFDLAAEPVPLTISSHRENKKFDLLTFQGYEHINDVEKWKGSSLKVKAEDRISNLDPDEYYFDDIIGCRVSTVDGQDIGVVHEILQPGANDVWVVQMDGPSGKEVLIPYTEEVVKQIDIKQKQISIQLIEGLIE